jgi:hypothetical protein
VNTNGSLPDYPFSGTIKVDENYIGDQWKNKGENQKKI